MSAFDIDDFLKTCSDKPGVYQMIDASDTVIYVGKAKNLKKRLSSYFKKHIDDPKTAAMVKQIHRIQLTLTPNEVEALVLEHQLIKSLKPRYNVVLRDDKSYPYVHLTADSYPRIMSYRGSTKKPGQFFGPYPSASAVRQSIQTIQKLFLLRQCDNSYFKNRSRPCLQYQIKRCSAPCVGKISEQDYAEAVKDAGLFYQGKNQELIQELVDKMEKASNELQFERAAQYRDQIGLLKTIVQRQTESQQQRNIDVFSLAKRSDSACIHAIFIRHGQVLGSQSFFPRLPKNCDNQEIFSAFINQFYLGGRPFPDEIISDEKIPETNLSLLQKKAAKKLHYRTTVRGDKARWLKMTQQSAINALELSLSSKSKLLERLLSLQDLLQLDELPKRIECFDVSHTMGEATVASCVVFDQNGPRKSSYRRYNITGLTPGDDYGAMKQALERRFDRESSAYEPPPAVLIVDGGPGQLTQAIEVLQDAAIDDVELVGIAKGEGRKAEYDRLITPNDLEQHDLASHQPARFLIQEIRDEAHRFAIFGHRKQREKARKRSTLEDIPGIGPKKRQQLIMHLGGIQHVKSADLAELQRVPGINEKLARLIYDTFH